MNWIHGVAMAALLMSMRSAHSIGTAAPPPPPPSPPHEEWLLHPRSLLGGPPAPMPASGTPQWTGPGASAKPRSNAKLAVEHTRGSPPAPVPAAVGGGAVPPECRRIQHASWSGSWESVGAADQALWKSAKCADKLRVRPEPSTLSACPKFPKDMKAKAKGKITAIKDSHKGETCVLIANGPSLNKIRWDWQDNFNVVMGMNKIFLGLERYNISKMTHYGACNPLVAEQSVKQIVAQLPESSAKFLTSSRQGKFPCDSVDHNLFFMGSEYKSDFVKDLASMKLNEGWTVTYWSLQVLYYIGCQQVVIVGMDHSFKQSGKPGKLEVFKGPDVNHFDESYFAGKQWHLAGLQNNERYYRIAKKQFEQAGRKIIDATVGGKCNIFEKGDYLQLLYPKRGRHLEALPEPHNSTGNGDYHSHIDFGDK